MINEIYLITALIIVGLVLIAWFINYKLKNITEIGNTDERLLKVIETLQKGTSDLQKGLQNQSRTIADTLHKSTKTMNERLDNAARFIAQVSKKVWK